MDDLNTLFTTLSTEFGSLTPELSAAIEQAYTTYSTSSSLQTLVSLASTLPLHPYDQLKRGIYGNNYKDVKFKTLDEVEEPANFVPHEMLQSVYKKTKEMTTTLSHNITCQPHEVHNTLLYTLSGDNFIPNVDAHKKHIEFIELIRSAPIDNNVDHSVVYSNVKKILTEFLNTY